MRMQMVEAGTDQLKRQNSAIDEVKESLGVLGFTVEAFLSLPDTARTLKELMLKVAVVAGGLP